MLGLGETDDEVLEALADLRAHDCDHLTLGQYLRPTSWHHPVHRYVTPETFADLKIKALALGFLHVESGPLVRSSYHAEKGVIRQ
jgi:lipoic acid synthetase